MRKALVFQDIAEFTNFVRLYEAKSSSGRGYLLYQIANPDYPRKAMLLLLGFRHRKSWFGKPLPYQQWDVEEKESQLHIQDAQSRRYTAAITHKREAKTLLGLVELIPWSEEPDWGHVLFWLRDLTLLERLVSDSFRLGNDRIQFATIQHERREAILLRIEKPSYYLLQWCLEQGHDLEVFHQPGEGLYVTWGYQHPMEKLWQQVERPPAAPYLFFRADGTRLPLTPPSWRDVYTLTDFSLDMKTAETWRPTEQAIAPFSIPLRLEIRARHREPELWMLEEKDLPALEQLLSLIDQQDLTNLLLSIQEDANGRRRFFLREKHQGQEQKHFEFVGQAFARYKGFHQLFLPVSVELQPQLRREQYRKLFQLEHNQLTVLSVNPEQTSQSKDWQQAELLTLAENSFEPLQHFIDYLLLVETNALSTLQAKAIFDLGVYTQAPKATWASLVRERTIHKPGQQRKVAQPASEQKETPTPKEVEEQTTQKAAKARSRTKKVAVEKEVSTLSELQLEEQDLERQLIRKGQSFGRWDALSRVQAQMKNWEAASTSLLEGMWLLTDPAEFAHHRSRLCTWLDSTLALTGTPVQKAKALQSRTKQEPTPQTVMRFVLLVEDCADKDRAGWLQQAGQLLRQQREHLRKKERWLMWCEIFRHNKDVREQAKIRGQILQELNEAGLPYHDIPHFIHNRLLRDRDLLSDEGQEEQSEEAQSALLNLSLIAQAIERITLPGMQAPAQAILARAYAKLGAITNATSLLQKAHQAEETLEPMSQGWIRLYTLHTTIPRSHQERKDLDALYQTSGQTLQRKHPSQWEQLQKCEISLRERKEMETFSRYLSEDNRNRLFPSHNDSLKLEVMESLEHLWTSFQRGQWESMKDHLLALWQALEADFKTPARLNYRSSAWLFLQTMESMQKLYWRQQDRSILDAFLRLVSSLPKTPGSTESTPISNFYFSLLQMMVIEGLVGLELEQEAVERLKSLLAWSFSHILVPLDYIDLCSQILTTVEVLQLRHRHDALQNILNSLVQQVTSEQTKAYYENSYLTGITLRLLDQIVEVALSKERLTMTLYKRYTDQDELFIRERLLTEDVCG